MNMNNLQLRLLKIERSITMKYKTKELITVLILFTITISFFGGRWTVLKEMELKQIEQNNGSTYTRTIL